MSWPKAWPPERRARQSEVMRRVRARAWAWLPDPRLRSEYERLRDNYGYSAAEAKRIILESYHSSASRSV